MERVLQILRLPTDNVLYIPLGYSTCSLQYCARSYSVTQATNAFELDSRFQIVPTYDNNVGSGDGFQGLELKVLGGLDGVIKHIEEYLFRVSIIANYGAGSSATTNVDVSLMWEKDCDLDASSVTPSWEPMNTINFNYQDASALIV